MIALYILCCVLFMFISIASTQRGPCKTPDNIDGNCIQLKECRPIHKLVTKNPPPALLSFLRKSHCGFEGSKPLVCCPLPNMNAFTVADLPPPGRCGAQTTDYIIGGTATGILDYPWTALLHYKNVPAGQESYFCGGTLIHKNYVVTAGHCIRGTRLIRNKFYVDYVRLGEYNLKSDIDCIDGVCADRPVDIPVAKTIVHENYLGSLTPVNDIAVLQLERSAPYTDFIRPICLPIAPHMRNRDFDGIPLIVVGLGITENASQSDVKLQLGVEGFNLNRCRDIFGSTLNSKHLCAGGEAGRNACNGDSGGPLMGKDSTDRSQPLFFLAGIMSFGSVKCGISGTPTVYTRVDQYLNWILGHMQKSLNF